jgi:hypothetical protein
MAEMEEFSSVEEISNNDKPSTCPEYQCSVLVDRIWGLVEELKRSGMIERKNNH